jgi:hypothetical protein
MIKFSLIGSSITLATFIGDRFLGAMFIVNVFRTAEFGLMSTVQVLTSAELRKELDTFFKK